MRKKIMLLAAATAVMTLAAAAVAQENYVKWNQPPDPAQPQNLFYGWNEISLWGGEHIAADDWYCDTNDPVSDIHWWGSFIGWNKAEPPGLPASFHLAIWSDVPAAAGGFSHPGYAMWEYVCTDYTWEFVGWDFDPRTQTYEACFLFHCDLPLNHWFYQEPGDNIYWLSIAAEYGDPDCNADIDQDGDIDLLDLAQVMGCVGSPPTGSCAPCDLNLDGVIDEADIDIVTCQYGASWPDPACCIIGEPRYPFGWKTKPRDFNSLAPDAAVRTFDPIRPAAGGQWMSGEPIRWPGNTPEDDWDLAFYLTSKRGSVQNFKWRQPPVFNPESQYPECFWGWDEVSEQHGIMGGPVVADDWVCVDDRPVTDIHWWGSYLNWDALYPPQPPMGFFIGIWTDVPAGVDEWFSHPGDMIWMWYVPWDMTMEIPVGCDWHPDWTPFPETCFYYTFDIPESEWFYQEPGPTIYWLSIAADYPFPTEYPWGWKTRPRDLDSLAPDDAVRIYRPVDPLPGAIYEEGEPIFWPDPDHSWDTAFELTTTGEYEEIIKWYQAPTPYTPDDAYNGWNEHSVYGGQRIAGDDWVCENEDPISDVHWWGSFIGWGELEPPRLPDAFHIGIWTDVPAGADEWFSHPGDMLWEYVAADYTWTMVGWDFDPRDPTLGPETCYFFEVDIPRDMWFYQDPGQNIYWVTISAIYNDLCACDSDFDGDGSITTMDLSHLLSCFGSPTPPGCVDADLDCDGDVDGDDLTIFQCQQAAGWPDPSCCAYEPIEYPFGMKTRPRDPASIAPDDAVSILVPSAPVPGDSYIYGQPLFWPTEEDSWDLCFQLTATHEEEPPVIEPKWSQRPECYEGFDAESNLWWHDEQPFYPKWVQTPNSNWPGLHCDITIPLADDWRCGGGMVTDLHWFGNYENNTPGVGLAGWDVEIRNDGGGMPGVVLWSTFVPFAVTGETFTGLYNSEGVPIYKYEYYLTDPFPQEEGQIYWLVLIARPNAGGPAPQWRWQEAGRTNPPILNPAHHFSAAGGWVPLCWSEGRCTDFAFIITSDQPGFEVNKVVADDFYSDGRDILDVRWWGSYFDDRYMPDASVDPAHVIDGWFISYHYADYNEVPRFPPELMFDGHPTVLAIYFAPAEAVQIVGIDCTDCNGHALYEYYVDLDACCLVCSHPDPRNAYPPPGQPGAFQEIAGFRYWLDVQAVTGIEWLPDACDPFFTGHIPPLEAGATGAFWGWHTGYEPAETPGPLNNAALGRIVDFTPYPPDCWDYGAWVEQPWECPTPPLPANMSFELMASTCPENIYKDGLLVVNLADLADLLSRYGSCVGAANYSPAADFNNDGCIGLSDLAQLLSVYGQPCPTW